MQLLFGEIGFEFRYGFRIPRRIQIQIEIAIYDYMAESRISAYLLQGFLQQLVVLPRIAL